jgi:ribosomal protein S18 acetylase RimI-like enzyme
MHWTRTKYPGKRSSRHFTATDSTFRAMPLLNIHDCAVRPEYRRHGLGGRLLASGVEAARSRGCCKIMLEVRADNPAARALYERAGFGAGRSGDEPVQYLFLEKQLGD